MIVFEIVVRSLVWCPGIIDPGQSRDINPCCGPAIGPVDGRRSGCELEVVVCPAIEAVAGRVEPKTLSAPLGSTKSGIPSERVGPEPGRRLPFKERVMGRSTRETVMGIRIGTLVDQVVIAIESLEAVAATSMA